ncbi:hypothetical protein F4802DRAFT_562992 [Xylaria palmicola]|nr:hypothetical protein F4802DRAFT_562992 [Xylaria palmicola]
MDFRHSICHPEANPHLARARLRTIATYVLIADATVNTLALLLISIQLYESGHDSGLAFTVARFTCLALLLAAWLLLWLRIIWRERRITTMAGAPRERTSRLLRSISRRIYNLLFPKKSSARKNLYNLDSLRRTETAYQPAPTLPNEPARESSAQVDRANSSTNKNQHPTPQHFTSMPAHMSEGNGPQQPEGKFPFEDTDNDDDDDDDGDSSIISIDLGAGDVRQLLDTGSLEGALKNLMGKLAGNEGARLQSGAAHDVRSSISDAGPCEGGRAAVIEQARQHPALHLAASREMLNRRAHPGGYESH